MLGFTCGCLEFKLRFLTKLSLVLISLSVLTSLVQALYVCGGRTSHSEVLKLVSECPQHTLDSIFVSYFFLLIKDQSSQPSSLSTGSLLLRIHIQSIKACLLHLQSCLLSLHRLQRLHSETS